MFYSLRTLLLKYLNYNIFYFWFINCGYIGYEMYFGEVIVIDLLLKIGGNGEKAIFFNQYSDDRENGIYFWIYDKSGFVLVYPLPFS